MSSRVTRPGGVCPSDTKPGVELNRAGNAATMVPRRRSKTNCRRNAARAELEPLRDAVAAWAQHAVPMLADARPSLPDELSDRAQDVWELLIAITDFIGDAWPERARPAAVALSGRTTKDDEDVSIRLLADIRDCFALHPRVARVQTAELLEYLNSLDTSPWAGWHGGRGLSGQALAARLRGFRIRPHDPARYGDRAGVKGYDRAAFEDAWARLLPPGGVYDVEDVDDFSRQTNGPDSARETAPLNTSYASSTTSTPRTETPMNKGESRVDDRVEVAVDVPSAPARTSTMADEIDEFAARIIDLDFTKSLPLQDVRHSHFRPLLSRQRSTN